MHPSIHRHSNKLCALKYCKNLYFLSFILTWDAWHSIFVNAEIPNTFKWIVINWCQCWPKSTGVDMKYNGVYTAQHKKKYSITGACATVVVELYHLLLSFHAGTSLSDLKAFMVLVPVMHSHLSALSKLNNKIQLTFERRIVASSCTNTQSTREPEIWNQAPILAISKKTQSGLSQTTQNTLDSPFRLWVPSMLASRMWLSSAQ